MKAHIPFSIPIKGLNSGIHPYHYQVDQAFFESFENSMIDEGKVDCKVDLDKRPDMLVIQFDLEGWAAAPCDRCLVPIQLPIHGTHQLLVKFSEETDGDEGEVLYLHPESPTINLAKFIYEYICLSLPMIKVYDCDSEEDPPCDFDMLSYLGLDDEDDTEEENPVWDALKGLKKK